MSSNPKSKVLSPAKGQIQAKSWLPHLALENRSPLASNSASREAMPEHRIRGTRGQVRRSLLEVEAAAQKSSSSASNSASSETICKLMSWKRGHQRAIRTINHMKGTKLRVKRRKPSYCPEDLEAFYRLLAPGSLLPAGCPKPSSLYVPLQRIPSLSFLKADTFLKVSDKVSAAQNEEGLRVLQSPAKGEQPPPPYSLESQTKSSRALKASQKIFI
ncbi:hypothetical protein HJG60_011242 [Phyllostomus discolor]|uniref:Uncharacterized protein n=1 Tax=Phyllostomus discolor TaxID=89673 RepID=A0A834E7L8_9CHIR|nr:hypothetical protein HJG60_011242 [Phyllostomus discolor]